MEIFSWKSRVFFKHMSRERYISIWNSPESRRSLVQTKFHMWLQDWRWWSSWILVSDSVKLAVSKVYYKVLLILPFYLQFLIVSIVPFPFTLEIFYRSSPSDRKNIPWGATTWRGRPVSREWRRPSWSWGCQNIQKWVCHGTPKKTRKGGNDDGIISIY